MYEEKEWSINEIFVDAVEDDAWEEDWQDRIDSELRKQLEKASFEDSHGHGKFAHAYNHSIDNIKILQLREKGQSLREIAKYFHCSPSTIRNRLMRMGIK